MAVPTRTPLRASAGPRDLGLPSTLRRRLVRPSLLAAVAVIVVTAVGLAGAYRYIWTFWLYRGFPPPTLPLEQKGARGVEHAVLPGTLVTVQVPSPAVGEVLPALVYLPPGYFTQTTRRYPVLYLLHGVPGSPEQFVDVGDAQVAEALLVARGQMPPTILVMPEGAPNLLDDTEWVNGAGRHQAWMNYIATDVVRAIDHRFRTIARRADRAIAGLSEGGYAALNIGLHHLGEFGLLESWSGYTKASTATRYFGGRAALEAANSPALEAVSRRASLVAHHTYIWFYCGRSDEDLGQNVRFDEELALLGVPHHFLVRPGAHNWKLWRGLMSRSLIVAGRYFSGSPDPAGGTTASGPVSGLVPGADGLVRPAPARARPGVTAPRRQAGLAAVPGRAAPGARSPRSTVPGRAAPGARSPRSTATGRTAPGRTAPGSTAPLRKLGSA